MADNVVTSTNTPKFNPERYLWLKQHLALDLLSLDEELQEISYLIQDAAENTALANEMRDTTKEHVNLAAAAVASDLRNTQLPSGKTRSETQISSELLLSDVYRSAVNESADARLDAALWASLLDGFKTKASSLRSAAELITAGYITQDHIINKRRVELRKSTATT